MKNNKIALFLDIDGTLYDNQLKGMRPKTIELLNELSNDDNYDLYIASGRSMNTIHSIKEHFNKFKGFVLANGQVVIIDDKYIYNNSIEYNEVNKFIDYCDNNNHSVVLVTDGLLYYNFFSDEMYNNFTKYIQTPVYPLNGRRMTKNDIVNEMWIFLSNDELVSLRPKFPNLNIINWGKSGADIIPLGGSKGNGVKKVIEHMGYELSNTYAFGDSDNDTVMFEVVGTAICMGNGTDIAKKHADIICDTIYNDGLVKAFNEYIRKH